MLYFGLLRGVAQLVARSFWVREAPGSSPGAPIKQLKTVFMR